MKHVAYIAGGSNLGDREANLQAAVKSLPPKVSPLQVSSLYETPPWGVEDQPDFLNLVLKAETDLDPLDLLHFLKRLEVRLGREPSVRYGPRSIDLDILFYDDLVLETPELTIPHPRLHERAFVLVPLAEIAPQWVHPVLKRQVRDLLAKVDRSGITRFEA